MFGIVDADGGSVSLVTAPVGASRVEPRRRRTGYERPVPGVPAFRPGGPADRRPVPGPGGHRVRPVRLRCDDPRVAARAAALRRRHLLLGIVALAAVVALAVPWGTKADRALVPPAPAGIGATASPATVYVVQPGDTALSISRSFDHGGDQRSLATAIRAQVGGGAVRPGERLVLP